MTNAKLDIYKSRLEKEKQLIEAEIRENDLPPDFGGGLDDEEQETDQGDALSNQLAVVQDLKNRLLDVEAALRKVIAGVYGVCENCKKEIEADILDIDPESRLCLACKAAK